MPEREWQNQKQSLRLKELDEEIEKLIERVEWILKLKMRMKLVWIPLDSDSL